MEILNKVNIVYNEDIINERLAYVVDFLNNYPLKPKNVLFLLNGNENNCLNLYYTSSKEKGISIPAQLMFFRKSNTEIKKVFLNKYYNGKIDLYSVEGMLKMNAPFYNDNIFGFDILEMIFFHISRFEEVFCDVNNLDKHKRLKSSLQVLRKNNLHNKPVVDNLVFNFFKILGFNIDNQKTTYSLTHDIDIIRKYDKLIKLPKTIVRSLLMGLKLKGVFKNIRTFFDSINNKKKDPYYTFDWLFRSESGFANKIVYFVVGGKTKFDYYSKTYLKELPEIIKEAKNKGYELGLHPSYNAYDDSVMFSEEKDIITKYINYSPKNVRMHFLRINLVDTFKIIENLNFSVDSTLGYSDEIGFRCGTGFKYHPYNFEEERKWKFMELPLVFMDSALHYNSCNQDIDCFETRLDLFLKENRYNTHITFNFHNSTFDEILNEKKYLKNIFSKLITTIS